LGKKGKIYLSKFKVYVKEVWKLIEERKRFPADTTLNTLTFLNDKKINGELYAYLQGRSSYKVLDKE
jgi:hypothetical protein